MESAIGKLGVSRERKEQRESVCVDDSSERKGL